jgi:hypothetical protein
MAWLAENYFWVLIFIAFISMHLFGHGGHGGHGGHAGSDRHRSGDETATDEALARNGAATSSGHQH